MADAEETPENTVRSRRYWPRRRRWQFLLVLLILLLISTLLTWRSREPIVGDLIESQLAGLGIEATYEIESIEPTRQVLRNFTIGDPQRPDLVIERVELVPVVGFTSIGIGSVTLVRPHLRATFKDGKLSLGALDPLLRMETEEPAGLPDWRLNLIDGRARVFTDNGVIGAKVEGAGRLSDGFEGVLAAAAPRLEMDGCSIASTLLVGRIFVARGQPGFVGPLQIDRADCHDETAEIGEVKVAIDLKGDRDLAGLEAKLALESGALRVSDMRGDGLKGSADLDWRDGLANARYRIAAARINSPALALASLEAQGAARLRPEDGRFELDSEIEARDPRLGPTVEGALRNWRAASAETPAEPLLVQFSERLGAALPGSRFSAELTYRLSDAGSTLVVPSARLRDPDGESLFAVSQLQYSSRGKEAPRLAGNFSSGGEGLPQIYGRMEAGEGANTAFNLQMAPYRSGTSSMAVPRLKLVQNAAGEWSFDGSIEASGSVPGGSAEGLSVPIQGRWSKDAGLAVWQQCTQIGLSKLAIADLVLERQSFRLCPANGGAVIRLVGGRTELGARIEGLALQGRLGENPIALESAELEFTSARGLAASEISVMLGAGEALNELRLADLRTAAGDSFGGTFSGVSGKLAAVPLDLSGGAGQWRYSHGTFALDGATFELRDRMAQPRFYPLKARGASLSMRDGAIAAQASLRHPASDRVIAEVVLRHELASGVGHADLFVPGLLFDEGLQPDQVTILASGVIALVNGNIVGQGKIDWNEEKITSSGTFTTGDLDFAAAFGPVQGVSGTVEFRDLLSLTTAGPQRLRIGAINPGVEVFDGTLEFALRDATFVSVLGGRWPFFGGTMILRPTDLNLAAAETRNYVIEVVGADAARFVAAMELGNLNVSGVFDGAVPLVFDELGNGSIVNGLLISRPPGGNLSYIGELTYEDTGAMANFAFQALRSLDFNQMMVEMDGPLTGEIVTRVNFDGVRQGQGTSQNFVTRQIAKLPIRFRVNIRAPFYQLITSFKATYDPAFIRDPRDLGLLDVAGKRLVRPQAAQQSTAEKGNSGTPELSSEKQPIQTEESEGMR